LWWCYWTKLWLLAIIGIIDDDYGDDDDSHDADHDDDSDDDDDDDSHDSDDDSHDDVRNDHDQHFMCAWKTVKSVKQSYPFHWVFRFHNALGYQHQHNNVGFENLICVIWCDYCEYCDNLSEILYI